MGSFNQSYELPFRLQNTLLFRLWDTRVEATSAQILHTRKACVITPHHAKSAQITLCWLAEKSETEKTMASSGIDEYSLSSLSDKPQFIFSVSCLLPTRGSFSWQNILDWLCIFLVFQFILWDFLWSLRRKYINFLSWSGDQAWQ